MPSCPSSLTDARTCPSCRLCTSTVRYLLPPFPMTAWSPSGPLPAMANTHRCRDHQHQTHERDKRRAAAGCPDSGPIAPRGDLRHRVCPPGRESKNRKGKQGNSGHCRDAWPATTEKKTNSESQHNHDQPPQGQPLRINRDVERRPSKPRGIERHGTEDAPRLADLRWRTSSSESKACRAQFWLRLHPSWVNFNRPAPFTRDGL